jgi:aspartate aminotransferase-like enzyme
MKKYYLMAPGPTPVPSNVLLAMAQPMIHHRTPEYEALFIEVRAGLKRLFQTSQDVIPFTSSGTGALEAAVVNTLSAGDTALVLRAGKFGERWDEICRTYGITVIPLDAPFGHTVPAEAFEQALRAHPEAKASRPPVCSTTSGASRRSLAAPGPFWWWTRCRASASPTCAWTSGAWMWWWPGPRRG